MGSTGGTGRRPLPSWREGSARHAILDFVARVTQRSDPAFVPREERIAVFDNDGTLWCEKPVPVQAEYLLRKLAAAAERDPALRSKEPWRAAYERDFAWFADVIAKHYNGDDRGVGVIAAGLLAVVEGTSVEGEMPRTREFVYAEKNPRFGRTHASCAFQPMLELLDYLRENGFTTCIASGGGRDFIRSVSQDLYGIPPEDVIGSTTSLRWEADERGGSIRHSAKLDLFDDGPAKPVGIWNRLGRRPIFAAGNANGDIDMLRFTQMQMPKRTTLELLVVHDDDEREVDDVSGAERAVSRAEREGWTLVSMKSDWETIFAHV